MAVALKVLGASSAWVRRQSVPKNVKTLRKIKVWCILAAAMLGTKKSSKAFPCSVALVSFCTGAFPCSVALVFQFLMFQWVVQHGLSEGVRNVIKIMVFYDFWKMKGSKGWPTNGFRRTKYSKYVGKMNTLHNRHESSLASTSADPFFDAHFLGAPMGLLKTSKSV